MGDDTADAGETLGADQFDLDAAPAAAAAGARVGTAEGAQDQKKRMQLQAQIFEQKQTPPTLDKSGPERLVWDMFWRRQGSPQFWASRKLTFRAKTNTLFERDINTTGVFPTQERVQTAIHRA